jgi:vacuolar-type H+-ATPase subunit E/Vma4
MIRLYDSSDNVINSIVNKALSRLDSIKITNRLLDGTYHVQTIGNAVKMMDITCYVNEDSKDIIDNIEVTGALIKVVKDDKYYKGIIMEPPKSEQIAGSRLDKRRYQYSFTIAVNEEGIA